MTDFAAAIARGLKAHADAERATAEIVGVFTAMAAEIEKVTQQKVTVDRERSFRAVVGHTIFDAIAGALPPREPYDSLVATLKGTSDGQTVEICTYKLGPDGYPVTITYEGFSDEAFDKRSLEAVMMRLLEHPATGRRFQIVIDAARGETAKLSELTAGEKS